MPANYKVLSRTNSGAVKAGPGGVHTVSLAAGTNAATLILYNNTAGSGTVIWKLSAVANGSESALLDVTFEAGCYATLTGDSPVASVSYW